MIIYFAETERPDEEFFREAMPEHDLRFVNDVGEVAEDAEVLSVFIHSQVDAPFLAAHPQLRLVASRSTSLDHLDLGACREHSVAVTSVPGYGETTVAEHTFALMLALSRRLREVMTPMQPTQRFSYAMKRGFDLAGKTLGIVGMGAVGRRVTALAQAFAMRVIAYDPMAMPPELATQGGFTWAPLDELLREAHVISLHARLTPTTWHLLNRGTLARCRPGVLVINTARGGLIDTKALREALDSGQVGGAGLDVLEDERVLREPASQILSAEIVEHLRADVAPHALEGHRRLRDIQGLMMSGSLLSRPNVVFTPHVAFNSDEAVQRLNEVTAENIRAFLAGSPQNLA